MIVGTAGHIDHGKTTLVRALTGVDTDRLPEEKKRGISIELGYAFLDVPGQPEARVGFIDVPGHERLVHTMLAGATGIDLALLLVAAATLLAMAVVGATVSIRRVRVAVRSVSDAVVGDEVALDVMIDLAAAFPVGVAGLSPAEEEALRAAILTAAARELG